MEDIRRGDGQAVIERIEALCTVSKDGFASRAGEPLLLRDWQRQLLLRLFARRPDGRRRHRVGLIGMPRKNGKSAIGSCLALDGLLFDVRGAEVYSAAAEKEQARIVFGETKKMIMAVPDLAELCTPMRDVIEVPSTGSIYRVLSAEAYSKEGLNISRGLVDELHAHPTRELWDVLDLATGGRAEPMIIAITTAGVMTQSDGRDSICYELWKYGRSVAEGLVDDPSFFMAWWGAPDGADHTDPAVWEMANPGYGDIINPEDFAEKVLRTPENEFRTKRLNQWVAAATAWLPAGAWENCKDETAAVPDGTRVVLGFDGSYNNDSTALVVASVGVKPVVKIVRIWERPADAGEDWTVPIDDVEDAIRAACKRWAVREVLCDPYRWARSMQILLNEGLPIVEYPQSPERMVPATGRFYEAVMNGGVAHDGDPVLARHLRNCATKVDNRGARIVKVSKGSVARIDAAIAAVMAFDRAAFRRGAGGRDWLESLAEGTTDPPPDPPVGVSPEDPPAAAEPAQTAPWTPWVATPPPQMPDQTRAALDMLRNLPQPGR